MDEKSPIKKNNVHPLRIADSERFIRHVFIRDLILDASIGAYSHETDRPQKVRFNIDLSVDESGAGHGDDLHNVVCYDQVVQNIKTIITAGHINLVETLAERIADMALQDQRVITVRVRVEKLDAVTEAESVGVEIERTKS